MTFLDNGEVRIGMDLALGGAVTHISGKDHPGNLINSADLGRQIQMSHYSGPWPFVVGDSKPNPAWAGLGWNPIQTGDCYLNPSKVVEHRNTGQELYVKCNHLDLASSPEYRGLLIGLAIEPVRVPRPDEEIAIKSIVMSAVKGR